jgi:hypothetical protein
VPHSHLDRIPGFERLQHHSYHGLITSSNFFKSHKHVAIIDPRYAG